MKAMVAGLGVAVFLVLLALLVGFTNFWPGIPQSFAGWAIVAALGFGYIAAEGAGEILFDRRSAKGAPLQWRIFSVVVLAALGFLAYRYLPMHV